MTHRDKAQMQRLSSTSYQYFTMSHDVNIWGESFAQLSRIVQYYFGVNLVYVN
jgi:hypothetical protein